MTTPTKGQCCGNCRWWGKSNVALDYGFCNCVHMPDFAKQILLHIQKENKYRLRNKQGIYRYQGTACPTWKAREE